MNIEIPENISTKEAFEFVRWVGEYYTKLGDVWFSRFRDQRNSENLFTTEGLYKEWIAYKAAFSQALEDYG